MRICNITKNTKVLQVINKLQLAILARRYTVIFLEYFAETVGTAVTDHFDLAKEMQATKSAISHQLRALRIVRLVYSRKVGKNVFYSLQDEHIGWILEETYAHISER